IYYLAIGIAFISASVFFYILYKIRVKKFWTKALILLIVSIIPLIVYSFWLDGSGARELADRPLKPNGFFESAISLRDIFIPIEGLFKDIINIFIPVRAFNHEGYAYVGIGAMISTFAGIWVLRDRILEKEMLASSLGVFLIAAFF